MTTKSKILRLLTENAGSPVSGQKMAEDCKVSRNAVWRAINQLKKEGYPIEGRTNSGYVLTRSGSALTHSEVVSWLSEDCDILIYDSVTSTNDVAKTLPLGDRPAVLIADQQTAGKGRLGRSFSSPAGTGLYMSILFRPKFELSKSLYVTMAAAVAVCRAIETVQKSAGLPEDPHTEIKWVNDIFYKGKKVCGILTEAQTNFESGEIDRLIIGSGINCFPGSFPPEVADIAGPVADVPDCFSRSRLAAEVIGETLKLIADLESRSFFPEYRDRCFILGREVLVHPTHDAAGTPARAIDIDDTGGLIVEYLFGEKRGTRETLRSGEISLSIPK